MTDVNRRLRSVELLLSYARIEENQEVLLLSDSGNQLQTAVERGLAASVRESSHLPEMESLVLSDVASDISMLQGRRWSLVCVIDPQLDTQRLTQLLARIRDLHAERVLHIDRTAGWSLASSLALGFSQLSGDDNFIAEDGFSVFGFDIRTYKSIPNWLNSRYWANPELWGKHRW